MDRQPSEEQSLRNDLIKMVVDKLLLALLIVAAGFMFDRILARYKEEQSFIFQLNSIRANKIADVWEELYVIEEEVEKQMADLVQYTSDADVLMWSLSPQKQEIDSLGQIVKRKLSRNRVWMDPAEYDTLKSYTDLLISIERLRNVNQVKRFEIRQSERRENIKDIQRKLLSETLQL